MPEIEVDSEFSEHLKKLRHAAGWTQEEIAANLGVSRQTISSIENGKKSPSPVLYLAIIGLFLVGCALSPYIRGILNELHLDKGLTKLFIKDGKEGRDQ